MKSFEENQLKFWTPLTSNILLTLGGTCRLLSNLVYNPISLSNHPDIVDNSKPNHQSMMNRNQVIKKLKQRKINTPITPLKTNISYILLKIDGWKITFPFNMVPFQGTFLKFRGGGRLPLHFAIYRRTKDQCRDSHKTMTSFKRNF